MGTRSTQVLVAVLAVVAAAFAIAVAVVLLGGSDTATRGEYQASVVNGRDRVDYALEQITTSESPEELVERIGEASAVVGDVADDLGGGAVAEGFEDENDRLVETMRAFSDELAGTAAQFEDPTFVAALPGIQSLSFPQWEAVNVILAELKEKGIQVEPLARH